MTSCREAWRKIACGSDEDGMFYGKRTPMRLPVGEKHWTALLPGLGSCLRAGTAGGLLLVPCCALQ
jgi:hypothetical protein